MSIIVLNPNGFSELSKYSGNPFLDAMTDLQGVFSTLMAYQQHKPYIDKYSDASLSDLKDKIKAYIPEALNDDGSINFAKLEELASNGNIMANSILGIKQARENFSNASIGEKLATFLNKDAQGQLDILSGNLLTKQAQVLKRKSDFENWVKNSNMPDEYKAMFLANEDVILNNPQALSILTQFFGTQQGQQSSQQEQQTNPDDNTFQAPQIKSMQDIFNKNAPQLKIDNSPNGEAQVDSPDTKTKKSNKKKSKTQIPTILGNSKIDQTIINTLKSAPSYPPPVIYSSDQIQGSPQWNNDIINQIVNYRPLFK